MPELPEVEAAARLLRQMAAGRTIASVRVLHPAQARTLPPRACQRLAGRQIAAVDRRAKIQLITLDDGQVLQVHFRLTGDWDVGHADDEPPPHERLRLTCTDGTRVSLVDARALSVVTLHAPGTLRLPPLGPEPLGASFTATAFAEALRTRHGPIKPVLLDQRVVAGVGNIYAAEALWVARIHPARNASSLSRARVQALRNAIRAVLRAAPARRYYARADAPAAEDTPDVWRVYGREGATWTRCGATIRSMTQAGRTTYYCGGCQR